MDARQKHSGMTDFIATDPDCVEFLSSFNCRSQDITPPMKKPLAVFTIIFTLCLVVFATWQLFKGNLEAAFMPLPFLLIIYFYLQSIKK